MIITIPGRPMPAVRMTKRSKWSNPLAKKYLAYKDLIGTIARMQYKEPTDKEVGVYVRVFLTGVKTPMGRDGDVDNYAKSALDGLNKIAWIDDRQVTRLTVTKIPCQNKASERMEIVVELI